MGKHPFVLLFKYPQKAILIVGMIAGLPTREQQWLAKRISQYLEKVTGSPVDVLPPSEQAQRSEPTQLFPNDFSDDFDAG